MTARRKPAQPADAPTTSRVTDGDGMTFVLIHGRWHDETTGIPAPLTPSAEAALAGLTVQTPPEA